MERRKVCFIGDPETGKTTLRMLLQDGVYKDHASTLGVDVTLHPRVNRIYDIWDCAGRAGYGFLREGYYIGSQAAAVFYDVSRPITFEHAKVWARVYKATIPNAKIVIVGNKTDIEVRNRYNVDEYPHIKISVKNGDYEELFEWFDNNI